MIRKATALDIERLAASEAPDGLQLAATPIAPPEVLAMLAGVASNVESTFEPAAWLVVADDEVVGLCSVVKPPTDGVVEIGYGIAPSGRRSGHATAAVAEIVAWAQARTDVTALAAETSVTNIPSQTVLVRNGFVQTGERHDEEDGPLFCWRLLTRPPAGQN